MVFSKKRIQKSFTETITFFQSKQIPYMVVGALAVAVWGRSRATADLDFHIDLPDLEPIIKRLPPNWKLDEKWDLYNPLLRHLQKRIVVSGIIVDFMLPRDAFERRTFSGRIRKKILNKMAYVIGPEDLILTKMKVGRPRDFDDAASIIELHPSLNHSYIQKWSERLGLHEEYTYLFGQKHQR